MGSRTTRRSDRGVRFLWPLLTLPGTVWLVMLFLVPLYAVLAVTFGTELDFFAQPIPEWNPLNWDATVFMEALRESLFGIYRASWVRTLLYCGIALTTIVLVGYPIAYYVARLAGRRKYLLLALLMAPWWINYLTRMLAWTGLLNDEGLVNDALELVGIGSVSWLSGKWYVVVIALIYGYLPFFIVPLYAYLDQIDQNHLEVSRDLGANSVRTFVCVTLPQSRIGLMTALVITGLPMFGDYYTNQLVSGSPGNYMIGNQIVTSIDSGFSRAQGSSLVLLLSMMLLVFMVYYLVVTIRQSREYAS